MPNVSEVWRHGHPWAVVYDFGVERERLRRPLGRLLFGADTRRLFAGLAVLDDLPVGATVLDVPCGGGVAVRALRRDHRLRYVAADISPAMLQRTRRRGGVRGLTEVHTCAADMARMPFRDRRFDACLCFNGLHCVPDPAAAVREVARCLKPGGRLEGTVFLADSGPRYLPLRAAARLMGVLGPSGGVADVQRWLRDAGFTPVSVQRMGALARFSARRG